MGATIVAVISIYCGSAAAARSTHSHAVPTSWANSEGKKLVAAGTVSVPALKASARQKLLESTPQPTGGEINAAFIKALQAADTECDQQLRDVIAQMDAIKQQKAGERKKLADWKKEMNALDTEEKKEYQALANRREKLETTLDSFRAAEEIQYVPPPDQ